MPVIGPVADHHDYPSVNGCGTEPEESGAYVSTSGDYRFNGIYDSDDRHWVPLSGVGSARLYIVCEIERRIAAPCMKDDKGHGSSEYDKDAPSDEYVGYRHERWWEEDGSDVDKDNTWQFIEQGTVLHWEIPSAHSNLGGSGMSDAESSFNQVIVPAL